MKANKRFFKDIDDSVLKEILVRKSLPAAIAMMHVSGDFNLGTCLRNVNFFGFREFYYIGGSRKWDRRSAVGVHHYTDIIHCPTEDEFFEKIRGKYIPVAVENNIDYKCQSVYDYPFDINEAIYIFGEEQRGLQPEVLDRCAEIIQIPREGCVASLNVGTCSGIIMSMHRNVRMQKLKSAMKIEYV